MRTLFIDPGILRTELVLEDCQRVDDGLGGFTETWAQTDSAFGMIEPLRAEFRFGADQTLEEVTHQITLRWRAGVASGMRLRKGARIFDVVTVSDPDESGRYLVCRTKEKGA